MLVTLSGITVFLQPKISLFVLVLITALLLFLLSYVWLYISTTMLLIERQPANALSPMLVTPLPIVTLVSPVHPENAELPMLVTLSGIVMLVSPVHL